MGANRVQYLLSFVRHWWQHGTPKSILFLALIFLIGSIAGLSETSFIGCLRGAACLALGGFSVSLFYGIRDYRLQLKIDQLRAEALILESHP